MDKFENSFESRIISLEKRVASQCYERVALFAMAVLLMGSITLQVRASEQPTGQQKSLRTRELIVEDDKGNPRVVIAGKMPSLAEAKYDGKDASGIYWFNGTGTLRMSATAPGIEPKGLGRRSKGDVGILIFDPKGKERGGYGLLADGTGLCTLDSVNGAEAIALAAWPNGTSSLGLWSEVPKYNTPIWLSVQPNGQPSLVMRDKDKNLRLFLGLTEKSGTALQMIDAEHNEAIKIGATSDGKTTVKATPGHPELETGLEKSKGS